MISRGFITDYAKVVQASTADWQGTATTTPEVMKFDTLGYRGALVLVNTGAASGDSEVSLTLTQSDTQNGTFATVSGTSVTPTVAGDYSGNLVIYDVADLSRRWLAVNAVKSGETPSVQIAVTAVLYNTGTEPIASVENTAAGVFVKRILNA